MLKAHTQRMFLWLLETIIGEEGRFYLQICSTVCQPSSKLGQDPKTAFYFRAVLGMTHLTCGLCTRSYKAWKSTRFPKWTVGFRWSDEGSL